MALSFTPQRSFAIDDVFVLPPGFRGRLVGGDPWAEALDVAAIDHPGTVFWSGAGGLLRAGILLAPDRPVCDEVLVMLGLVATIDALAVLAPPHVPLHVTPRATIVVDGGAAGVVRSVQAAAGAPSWAVLGVEIVVASDQASPGDTPDCTSLFEEGFGDVTPGTVLQHVCRHLLGWIDIWREDGDDALYRAVAGRHVRRSAA